MKVLLLGDYSGLHLNLAQGLRALGVNVTVASGGDLWKDFERDIDLQQPKKFKRIGFLFKLIKNYPRLCGHDVVQFIHPNPLATSPKFAELFFELIRFGNKKVFLGANGMDYYYCSYAIAGKLKYSVFQIPDIADDPLIRAYKQEIATPSIERLNKRIAKYATGITACSYGYYKPYKASFPDKITHIPLPINTDAYPYIKSYIEPVEKVKFFLGKMKGREVRKGVDVIERVLLRLKEAYPDEVGLNIVSSLPFDEYQKVMDSSHVLCDQMYAYGVGMNGMIAMTKGLISAGGADEEMYSILGESDNMPIIDLNVSDDEMFKSFEHIVKNKHLIKEQSEKSREYVVKHHSYVKVAQEYLDFWTKMCCD